MSHPDREAQKQLEVISLALVSPLSLSFDRFFAVFFQLLRPAFAVFAWRKRWMRTRGHRGWPMAAILALLAGCSSAAPIAFQNTSHREIYSLSLQDLEKLQFYISTDVVAHYQDGSGTKSLLLPRLTPGVVTSAGPNWLKVSFKEGGADVPFLADLTQYDPRYWIASEVEGSKDFKRIAQLPGEAFIYKGTRYTLVSGADAYLLVDWEGWKKVVETRVITGGRRVGEK
jgi:hypothetical protein